MTDRELLELAAKAARYTLSAHTQDSSKVCVGGVVWNPLTDDGDALRLVVGLNLNIWFGFYDLSGAVFVGGKWDGAPEAVHEVIERDVGAAIRRAIVRAAAEIGKATGQESKA
jgi:hypothetical protein